MDAVGTKCGGVILSNLIIKVSNYQSGRFAYRIYYSHTLLSLYLRYNE